MSLIYKLIDSVVGSGTNEKELYVTRYKSNEFIKDLFQLMLCPSIIYNIKKIPTMPELTGPPDRDDEWLAGKIRELIWEDYRGKDLKDAVKEIYTMASYEHRTVFSWILARKNPAKIGKSIVNKIWPGLVRTQDYMGALPGKPEAIDRLFKDAKKVNGQIKEDGCCILIDYEGGCPTRGRTRQGNDIGQYFPEFMASLSEVHIIADDGRVTASEIRGFNGMVHHELFCKGMDRQTGNGLINKQVKNGWMGGDVDNCLHSVLLDYRDDNDPMIQQDTRHINLAYFTSPITNRVLQRKLKTPMEARAWAKTVIRGGGEGLVLKDSAGLFKNGKHWNNLKIKNEFPVDLIVTAYKPHSTKPGLIGSLRCSTSDGKLEVWVNARTEADRALDFGEYWDGQVFKVLCESVIYSKRANPASLYLPRFNGNMYGEYVCIDKGKADTYQEVLDQEAMSKELK